MSGHTWSVGYPYGPICEVCSVALGTEFADAPCPGSKDVEIEKITSRVADLEGERDELKTQLRIEVAELSNEEGMRAQCEDEALSASLRAKVAESRAEELQAQLDRANASKLRIQRDSDRESKCERDESEHQCDACARCFQRVSEQLERATGEIGAANGMIAASSFLIKKQQEQIDRKPAEPRPMSEAPRDEMLYLVLRDGTERGRWRWTSGGAEGWSVNDVWVEPIGWWPVPTTTEAQMSELQATEAGGSGNLMVETKSGIVDPMGVNPTPSGSEWQEHGEGWSDEAMLAGGRGDES